MSSWSIQHIPAAAPKSAVTKTIAAWGISSAQLQLVNWGIDTLSLTVGLVEGLAAATPLFGYRDTLVLIRDSVIVFRGTITAWPQTGAPEADGFHYTAQGAGWWLQFYPFSWLMYPEDSTVADAANRLAWRWANYALQSAITGGAPLAVDAGGTSFATLTAPCPDLRASANCAEVLARVARLHPLSAGWWDYSGATPVARAAARAGLTPYTLDLADYAVGSFGLTPRPDLQLQSVRIGYSYPNSTAGWPDVVDYDDAGTSPANRGPNRLHVAIEVEDAQAAADAYSFGIAALIHNALKDLVWEGSIPLTETGTALPLLRPGYALSIVGGRAEWETMATVIQSVTYTLAPEQPDTMTITLGAPEHLGPQDYLELARAGYIAGAGAAGNPSPYPPPPPPGDDHTGGTPGTLSELNGGNGGLTPTKGGLVTEVRGGACTLIGYPANSGYQHTFFTQPERRWRTRTLTGSTTYRAWGWLPDNGGQGYDDSVSGSSGWTAAGVAFDTGTRRRITYQFDGVSAWNQIGDSTTSAPYGLGVNGNYGFQNDGQLYIFNSSATAAFEAWDKQTLIPQGQTNTRFVDSLHTPLGNYNYYSNLGEYRTIQSSGRMHETLSAEDTEDDAYARCIAAAPAWVDGTTALYTQRMSGSGVAFTRRHLRYGFGCYDGEGESRIWVPLVEGLKPWWTFKLIARTRIRPVHPTSGLPVGDWVEHTTYTHPMLADMSGNCGLDWQELQAPAGYELDLTIELTSD